MINLGGLVPCPFCGTATMRVDHEIDGGTAPEDGECILNTYRSDPHDIQLPRTWLRWCWCGFQADPEGYPPLPTYQQVAPALCAAYLAAIGIAESERINAIARAKAWRITEAANREAIEDLTAIALDLAAIVGGAADAEADAIRELWRQHRDRS